MQMNKLLIVFLLFLAQTSQGAVNIVFLNGIDGYAEKSTASRAKLKDAIHKAGFSNEFNKQGVRYLYWLNPGDGFIDDKIELYQQAALSGTALTLAKINNPGAQLIGSPEYKLELGKLYAQGIARNSFDDEDARHNHWVVKNFSAFIKNLSVGRNSKIIVVAHSQGNFFSEAVDAYLRFTLNGDDLGRYTRNVRYVGAASVAGSTPNNRYISASEDNALNLHAAFTAGVINFSVLPRNSNICQLLDPICIWKTWTADFWTQHGFQEIYTSDLPDIISKSSMGYLLAKHIRDSLIELTGVGEFSDDFLGSAIDSSKWNNDGYRIFGSNNAGTVTVSNGFAQFPAWGLLNTKGKVTLSGSKIVIEARMTATGANWDSHFELVDEGSVNYADQIRIGATNYFGGMYAQATGGYSWPQQHITKTAPFSGITWMEYRLTIDGDQVTAERGPDLSNITQTITFKLSRSIAGRKFFLAVGTGDPIFSPSTVDWIRVSTYDNGVNPEANCGDISTPTTQPIPTSLLTAGVSTTFKTTVTVPAKGGRSMRYFEWSTSEAPTPVREDSTWAAGYSSRALTFNTVTTPPAVATIRVTPILDDGTVCSAATKTATVSVQPMFIKISNSGQRLPDSASPGLGAQDWGCTQDTRTGDMYEAKVPNTFRRYGRGFTFFTSTDEIQKYVNGVYLKPTAAEVASPDNAKTYIDTFNAGAVCGRTNWNFGLPPLVNGQQGWSSILGQPADGLYWTGSVGWRCPFGGCTGNPSAWAWSFGIQSPYGYSDNHVRQSMLNLWLVSRSQ